MRRLLLALLLLPGLAFAVEPKPVVMGPRSARVGELFFLDVSESVSDPETPLAVSFSDQPNKPIAKLLLDDGKPSIVRVLASEPGTYYAVVAATGKVLPDGPPVTKFAVWPIVVTADPGPPPTPNPNPDPTPNPNPPGPNPTPNPPLPDPTSLGEKLGREFGPKLAASLADGFETAATMLAAGTSAKDADDALKAKFQANRWKAFAEAAGPTFDAVVPAGSEPKDAATREAFAKLHRDFARGLRGAR